MEDEHENIKVFAIIVSAVIAFLGGMLVGAAISVAVDTNCSYDNHTKIANLVDECEKKDTNKRGCVIKAYEYYCE